MISESLSCFTVIGLCILEIFGQIYGILGLIL
jgi:hypothetical protein